ncbi:hypothetical protein DFP77_107149 [Marinomonas foliarum]|uniref:Uncharacterized protein n=1 Tax=Marinomonas foliarum TaxID=491950 RepID=A0A369ACI0_9GAMM|nr:hypothetical protein DFP77_107149 [Marinomonas foliarum]
MPIVLLAPLLSGVVGFGAGWWAGDSFGWVKWLLIFALAVFGAHKMGVI